LLQVLGILTRVLDGHGLESDSGAQGHRSYHGEYMFTMLGAAVDIPRKVYKHLSALGPKLYFLRLLKVKHDADFYLKEMKGDSFDLKIGRIRTALYKYLAHFEINPLIEQEEGLPPKVPLNREKDDELTCKHIVELSTLLGPLRAAVPTWETRDTQGSSYAYSIPNIEEPTRAITILHNLAAGHAISQGRDHINIKDLPILIQVVLSTASLERSKIFQLLIENKGYLKTSDITDLLNTTAPTARRIMTELKAVGLVSTHGQEDETYHDLDMQITLNDDFKWFLSSEFQRLKRGDTSRQITLNDDDEKDEKENHPPRSTNNPILLLSYYSMINKKINSYKDFSFSSIDPLRGGENSFPSFNEPQVQAQSSFPDNGIKKHTPYWSPDIGLWSCENCKRKGDRFDMHDGVCRGK
jgi:hypothetical protein